MHTWGLWTSQTEWPTAMELPAEHGSGPRNCFSTLQTWPFLTHFLYTSHVAARWRTKISVKFSFAKWLSICKKEMWQLVALHGKRPSPTAPQLSRLEVKHSQHLPSKGKQQWCHVCSLQKQTRSTLYFCRKCDVGLCVVNCFEKWHTRVNLSR